MKPILKLLILFFLKPARNMSIFILSTAITDDLKLRKANRLQGNLAKMEFFNKSFIKNWGF